MSTFNHDLPDRPPFDFDVSSFGELPRLNGLLVTGTDTGVGKTVVAAAIARWFYMRELRAEVFKPAASGCRRQRGDLVSEDAEFLAAWSESARPLHEIAPVRFAEALAPNVAAMHSGESVDLDAIFAAYRRLEESADVVIVEGIGGLLCPISDDFWVIHLAMMMALPVVIVARPGLGTINHTLLTIHAARSAGLRVAGVVINRYIADPANYILDEDGTEPAPIDHDTEIAILTNPTQVAQRGGTQILALVPEDTETSVADGKLGGEVSYAIDQVDWKKIAFLTG